MSFCTDSCYFNLYPVIFHGGRFLHLNYLVKRLMYLFAEVSRIDIFRFIENRNDNGNDNFRLI